MLLAGMIVETGLRTFFRRSFVVSADEGSLLYRYHARFGWFPIPKSTNLITANRTITAGHNSQGFRGPEFAESDKPAILFLGDSFTWGLDAQAEERFTDLVQGKHPEWRVYNLGVSGYGTDQEYLLLQEVFEQYKPSIVFLMFCTDNDDSDNCANVRYGGYYKPYFTVAGTSLELKGIPVPRAERVFIAEHPLVCRSYVVRLVVRAYYKLKAPTPLHNQNPTGPILRNMQKFVTSRGAAFVMGLTHSHPNLEEFLRFFHIPYIDLSAAPRFAAFGAHWTPDGHAYVSRKVDELLASVPIKPPPRGDL
jgi:hypothetical protein